MLLMTTVAVETLAESTAALVTINASVATESLLFDLKQQLRTTQQALAKIVKHMETEMADYNWCMTRYEVSPRNERSVCPRHPTTGITYRTHVFLVSLFTSHCDAVKALIPEFALKIHGHSCIDVVKSEEGASVDCKVGCKVDRKVDCKVDCKVESKRKRGCSETRLSLIASWGETDSYATKAARLDTLELQLEEAQKVQKGLVKRIEQRVVERGASWGDSSLSDHRETTDATQKTYAAWFLRHACKIEDKIAKMHTSVP
ncbi:hypothetical protein T484DRAFT_1753860 [Baffinella frigidus]|nr:hypothetical protein T484DRAFT_1753860 [Cryptophyta sp. CCMP2293]